MAVKIFFAFVFAQQKNRPSIGLSLIFLYFHNNNISKILPQYSHIKQTQIIPATTIQREVYSFQHVNLQVCLVKDHIANNHHSCCNNLIKPLGGGRYAKLDLQERERDSCVTYGTLVVTGTDVRNQVQREDHWHSGIALQISMQGV